MVGVSRTLLACVISIILAAVALSSPASALERGSGDFWTYEMTMNMEGVDVVGEMTYTFDGTGEVMVSGITYEVARMTVSGSVSGTEDFLGSPLTVDGTFSGTSYETVEGFALVKEDIVMSIHSEWGEYPFQIIYDQASQMITTYKDPLFSGFDPGSTQLGYSWDETVIESYSLWENNTLQDNYTVANTYTFLVAPNEEPVDVPAGNLTTIKIQVTDQDDNYEIYWYSADVANWVKIESYWEGDDEPYLVMELSEYDSGGLGTLMLVLIASAIVVAVIVIVVILMMMRKRRGAVAMHPVQQMPPQYPPPTQ